MSIVISTPRNGSATINGRGINHRNLSRQQRARLAADVVTGARGFVPSCEQACVLFGVPRYVLSRCLKARREFAARHPEMAAGNSNGNGHHDAESLAAHLGRATPDELVAAARVLGVDRIWDRMIAPIITEERASQQAAE
jgi:hypothetical protein